MLRFGAVTIDVSHPKTFARVLGKSERARYTAVFNDGFRPEEQVAEFAEANGATVYKDLDEMIDNIDLGLIHACNWDKHLDYIMHFVRKGKPVFVDKPIVGNLKDCERLLELTRDGAVILGTSALRFIYEGEAAKKKMREEGCEPLHVAVTVGMDEFNYAIHAAEEILGIIESRPISCRYIGKAEKGECCETYFLRFECGATATIHAVGKKYVLANTVIITNSTAGESDITFTPLKETLYDPLIDRICTSVETGVNALATMEETVDGIKVLLAMRASRNAGGKEIMLSDPVLYDVKFDGYEFERGYAENALKKK